MSELIPKHGGYRKLKGFQVAQLVYDITVRFCDRQVERLAQDFENEGGFTERLFRVRKVNRRNAE